MSKTFISYARADAATALRIAKHLRDGGIDLWLDQLDIPPGKRWDREVEAALKACPGFVVLLSPTAVDSDNVLDEVGFALDHSKEIVPVLIAACDVPLRLRRLHYIDLVAGEASGLSRLKDELKRRISVEQTPSIAPSPSGQQRPAAKPPPTLAATTVATPPAAMLEANVVYVPDIGDFRNIPIVELHVKPGQTIDADDPVVTIESDKALMEVPAPKSGTVGEVLVKVGDKVSQGSALFKWVEEGKRLAQ